MLVIYIYFSLYSQAKHKYNSTMIRFLGMCKDENGSTKSWMITTICLIVLIVGLLVSNVWFYIMYSDQKNNVDSKIEVATASAKESQINADELKFTEREKLPNREFVGPDDYGHLTFNYPKTWSVYVNKDASGASSGYEAYFNPLVVPTVSATQQFAIRLTIKDGDYSKVIDSYADLVKKGSLKSSATTIGGSGGSSATKLEGNFTKDIRGIAVIFKIRDKVVTLRTDAYTFQTDFDAIVNSIKFKE